jgi:hypothetical protein
MMGGTLALLVFVALVCLSFGGGSRQPQPYDRWGWRSVLAVVVGGVIGIIIAYTVNPVR